MAKREEGGRKMKDKDIHFSFRGKNEWPYKIIDDHKPNYSIHELCEV